MIKSMKNTQIRFIAVMMYIMTCMGTGYSQSVTPPDQWQTTTASTVDSYADWQCDTVISRTWGHSLTLSCARVSNVSGLPMKYHFVLRCMNHGNYFVFDMLDQEEGATTQYQYNSSYYIRDMRVSDSICFFCGTKVTHRLYIVGGMGPEPFDTETIYEGFFGRIDMRWVKDSDLMVVPIAPGPGPGPTYPVPLTEWHPRVQITYIEEAATLARKVKEAQIAQKQKERDFIQARRAIERIRMVSGF